MSAESDRVKRDIEQLVERQSVEIDRLKAQNQALVAAIERQSESVDYSALEASVHEP